MGASQTTLLARGESQGATHSFRETLVEMTMARHYGKAFIDVDVGLGTLSMRTQADNAQGMSTGSTVQHTTARVTGAVGYGIKVGKAWVTPLAYAGKTLFPSLLERDLDYVIGAGVELSASGVEYSPYVRAGVAQASDTGDVAIASLFVTFGLRWTFFAE